jgi:dTDP-4-dehydrorhamnose 3,5-epimerase
MNVIGTGIVGLTLIELDPKMDERGDFTRIFCQKEFATLELETIYVQHNLSRNKIRGTVRGLHRQIEPYGEVKLVRCTSGAIFDVAVDFRANSPTYLNWFGVELSEANFKMLYIPKGFAHGYQSLTDNACVEYMVSSYYEPGAESGLRYDDPKLNISWPIDVSSISEKDLHWNYL